MKRAWGLLALLVLATLPLPSTAADSFTVQIRNNAFLPDLLTTTAGDGVLWMNADGNTHTVTFTSVPTGAKSPDSGDLRRDETFRFTPTAPGTYKYRCERHPSMTGTIVVQANTPPGIVIETPKAQAVVAGAVTFSGTVSDADAGDTVTVEWWIDDGASGRSLATRSGNSGWQASWDSRSVPNGTHTFHVSAIDNHGRATEASLPIVVRNNLAGRPPVVVIQAPVEDARLSGKVVVRGTVYDQDGDSVTLRVRVDGAPTYSTTGATPAGPSNWSFEWETTTWRNDPHVIEATASDGVHPSVVVRVNVVTDNPPIPGNRAPTVSLEAPASGSRLNGTVPIRIRSYDPDGDERLIELSIDSGPWVPVRAEGPEWVYAWDTTGVLNGEHRLVARARDLRFTTQSGAIQVIVENAAQARTPNRAPVATITSPTADAYVVGAVVVTGTAQDADGDAVSVDVRIDGGAWKPATGASPWSFTWDTSALSEGAHTIEARASDGLAYGTPVKVQVRSGGPASQDAPRDDARGEDGWTSAPGKPAGKATPAVGLPALALALGVAGLVGARRRARRGR